jgi:hypothetical protein
MTTIDYNVDNYTISELLTILNINEDNFNAENVIIITNQYINKFNNEKNTNLVIFFQKIQNKLLEYLKQDNKIQYQPDNTQTELWFKYADSLPQSDKTQRDKITDRVEKIDVYDNNHVPMSRQQLGINNTVNVPVAQDTLNPNLENITSRFINIDSQFRQASTTNGADSSSTDYTLDLSDPLTNVLNLRLYSLQIPFTWYVIDYVYGNTCFWITNKGNTFKLSIEPGNYTPSQFVSQLNQIFISTGFNSTDPSANPIVSYNINNGKLTINLNGYNDPSLNIINTIPENSTFNIDTDPYFIFFDFSGQLNCQQDGTCSSPNISFSNTLGWLMGYRTPILAIYDGTGNKAFAVLDLNGPKYFILVIDDFNQNHINNDLICITELSKKLSLPSYYNTSQPYICVNSNDNNNSLFNQTINNNNINALQDKLDIGYGKYQVVLPSAPRTLTQAQIYTINEIIKSRQKNTTYRSKAPTTTDTFALIPIKRNGLSVGDLYVEFGSSLQNNKRVYFGPVNIDRLRIKLLDDKGFLVDLHGLDWCFTLISENLYQY